MINNVGEKLNHFNIPTYNIIKLEKKLENGKTEPLLCHTDGGVYVVKSVNNIDGPRVLINEYICYKLAKLLNIPIPKAALINIEQDIIDADPKLQEINIPPGLHFGSEFVERAQSNIMPPLVEMITNKEDIPSIILFDQIIYNEDRVMNRGNLLIDLKQKRLLAIDHSHPFRLGAIWDKYELKKILESPICLVRDFHKENYRILLKYINGHSPFNEILQRILEITDNDIEWCFTGIPNSWGLDTEDRDALYDFIRYRLDNVNDFLMLLRDQLPNWKGGDIIG